MKTVCCNTREHKTEYAVIPVESTNFKTTLDGKETDLFTLQNKQGIKVAITNYGGRIVSLLVPDKNGNFDDIVLGFNTIEEYLNANESYYGALIGRYANRIDRGSFELDGCQYQLTLNHGHHHLHGGPGGFHNVVWEAKQPDNRHLVLHYLSENGEEGYPGRLMVQAIYELTEQNELTIYYSAKTTRPTIFSMTNHAFFNLAGAGERDINNHKLMIRASQFTPINSDQIPVGKMYPVKNTPFDFRVSKYIGQRIKQQNSQLKHGKGYDHNFVLNKDTGNYLALAARVTEPNSGRIMEIETTEPALQFYGGNFLDGSDVGKEGVPYKRQSAFCLEPQQFPNAPNHPDFPEAALRPHQMYESVTVYTFSTIKKQKNT